jgi:hypothetical protein
MPCDKVAEDAANIRRNIGASSFSPERANDGMVDLAWAAFVA